MPATSILGGINQEVTQQELLAQATLLLAAILEKMPRTDANDRAVVNTSDQGNVTVAIANNQDLRNLTSVITLGTLGRPTDAIPLHMSNAGVMHIYNNILVS